MKSSIPAFLKAHRRKFLIPLAVILLLAVVTVLALVLISPPLTSYLEGPEFRAELDKQTSKCLHFAGQYEPINRTAFGTAETDEFEAKDGVKAIKSLKAEGISAKFNPWGVFLRRWQLDYVHIKKGRVEVQTYEPKPDNKPPKPWYAIFLPDRVYLREVTCETADVTWRMGGKPGGIFETKVCILPYGRDFEYFASGGTLRSGGLIPELAVRQLHMVITKKILTLHKFEVSPKESKTGRINLSGEMGMREDKHVDMSLELEDIPVAPWVPDDLTRSVRGLATGDVHWKGTDQTINDSSGEGHLKISGGKLIELPLLEFMAAATAKKSLKTITLTECRISFRWKYPRFEITSLDLTGGEKVSIHGSLAVNHGALAGELDFGLAPEYLEWLPKARETIFTRQKDGLVWTKVRISGTLKEPVNDLTPRLEEALKKDPAAAAGLLLRGAGEWIEQKVKGN